MSSNSQFTSIDNNIWEDIKNQLNIVDVVGDYVQVKKLGGRYKVVCPFHGDKNPSLILSPEKGLWHCFGCGAGGDLFRFVMDYENVDKKTALEILAKKAGVELVKSKPLTPEKVEQKKQQQTKYEKGLEYLSWASSVYHKILLKILTDPLNPITQYCKQRGLSLETINKFGLGYAPKNGFLLDLCQKHSLNIDLMVEVGLLKENQNLNGSNKFSIPNFRDSFADRLLIPIQNLDGQVVGFTGRVLPYETNKNRPKYLNSGQSQWFDKSSLWFGYFQHLKQIKKEKLAIVVEGNMDVIACNQAGLEVVLASQGTSFTTNQLKILRKITGVVLLAFDNDKAGQASGEKFYVEAREQGLEVLKLIIPQKFKDIDEWLKSEQEQFFEKSLDKLDTFSTYFISKMQNVPFLDYWLQVKQSELTSDDSSVQSNQVENFLALMVNESELVAEHYLQKLSKITGFSFQTLKSEWFKTRKKTTKNQQKTDLAHNSTELVKGEFANQVGNENENKNQFKASAPISNSLGLSIHQLMRTTFQILVAGTFFDSVNLQKPDDFNNYNNFTNLQQQVLKIYQLLINFSPFFDHSDFGQYLQDQQSILEMVYQVELASLNHQDINIRLGSAFNSLMSFFDTKVHLGLLSPDLNQTYIELKSAGFELS
jgi:DNA primase